MVRFLWCNKTERLQIQGHKGEKSKSPQRTADAIVPRKWHRTRGRQFSFTDFLTFSTFWLINGRQPDLEVLPGSPDAWWTSRIGSFWGKRESGREPLLPADWRGSACCGWCQGALLQGKVLSIYPKFSFLSAVLINLLQNKWHHFWLDIWPKLSRSSQAQLG